MAPTSSTTLTVEITHSKWAWSDPKKPVVLAGGEHVLENPPEGLVRALGAAAAAGQGVQIVDGDTKTLALAAAAVESDEDSLAFQAKTNEIRAELLPQRDALVDDAARELAAAHAAAAATHGDNEDKLEAAHAAAAETFTHRLEDAVAWHNAEADRLIQERLG